MFFNLLTVNWVFHGKFRICTTCAHQKCLLTQQIILFCDFSFQKLSPNFHPLNSIFSNSSVLCCRAMLCGPCLTHYSSLWISHSSVLTKLTSKILLIRALLFMLLSICFLLKIINTNRYGAFLQKQLHN